MFAFSIPRSVINAGLALVRPRWRLFLLLGLLGIFLFAVSEISLINVRTRLAGMTLQEYLEYPDSDFWFFSFCGNVGIALLPFFVLLMRYASLAVSRIHTVREVEQGLRSLGLKKTLTASKRIHYHGVINNREVAVILDRKQNQRGMFLTPKPYPVTFMPSLTFILDASHRGDMTILAETTTLLNYPPNVIKLSFDKRGLPGKMVLTLDSFWSHRLLSIPEVSATIRKLAPEGEQNRHYNIAVGGHAVSIGIMFLDAHIGFDPFASFVTIDQVQSILADLQIIAEAAEKLPPPKTPGPDDLLARSAISDPMALPDLMLLCVITGLSLVWLVIFSSNLFR